MGSEETYSSVLILLFPDPEPFGNLSYRGFSGKREQSSPYPYLEYYRHFRLESGYQPVCL